MLAYDLPKKKQSQPYKNEQLIAYVLLHNCKQIIIATDNNCTKMCIEKQEEKGSVLHCRFGKGILTDYM